MGVVIIGCCQLGENDSDDVDEKHKIYLKQKWRKIIYIYLSIKIGVKNYERKVLKLTGVKLILEIELKRILFLLDENSFNEINDIKN